jgi:hypothetical protein
MNRKSAGIEQRLGDDVQVGASPRRESFRRNLIGRQTRRNGDQAHDLLEGPARLRSRNKVGTEGCLVGVEIRGYHEHALDAVHGAHEALQIIPVGAPGFGLRKSGGQGLASAVSAARDQQFTPLHLRKSIGHQTPDSAGGAEN